MAFFCYFIRKPELLRIPQTDFSKRRLPYTKKAAANSFVSVCSSLFSGPEGNRTPVRKPFHCGVSHHSRSFDIPSAARQPAGLRF